MHTYHALIAGLGAVLLLASPIPARAQEPGADLIQLPTPQHNSATSVEQALTERRSVRQFADGPITLAQVGQLLWAAQGVTERRDARPSSWPPEWEWRGGLRTTPSAGALYPLEVYVVAGNIDGLDPGVYRYVPLAHALEPVGAGDLREALSGAALRQSAIAAAPAALVIAAVYQRVAVKYHDRGTRYARIEVGAVAQSVYLQAQTLDLGTVLMGAFTDANVKQVLGLPEDHEPLAIMPVGRRP